MQFIPLKERTAVAVSEAILQNIVVDKGRPDRIVFDEDSAFANKLMTLICKTLKVEIKFVSPYNHGSLLSERKIGVIANFILSNLTGTGKDWPLFAQCSAYSYNTYALPSLESYSPYFLFYLRQPHDICGLSFDPAEKMTSSYKEYVELLQGRFRHVEHTILDL